MTLKLDKNKLNNTIIFVLLFLAAMNVNTDYSVFCMAAVLVLFVARKKLIVNKTFAIYLVLSLLMAAYSYKTGIRSMITWLSFASCYLIGYNIVTVLHSTEKGIAAPYFEYAQNNLIKILGVVSFGSFIHYLLNCIYNFNRNSTRNTNDIWTEAMKSATGQAAIACLMIGLSVAMILAPVKKRYRFIGIFCIFIIFAYNLILSCRTIPAMFLVILFAGLLFIFKNKESYNKKIKLVLGILMAVSVIAIIFTLDIGGIQKYITHSNFFERMKTVEEGSIRASVKIPYILQGYKYPFGGGHIYKNCGMYAHDLLLDGYDEYGLLEFILLAVMLFLGIKEALKLIRHTNCTLETKLAVLCVYLAVVIEFCIEPILRGMSWLFACYCLINGSIAGLNLSYYKARVNENESFTD